MKKSGLLFALFFSITVLSAQTPSGDSLTTSSNDSAHLADLLKKSALIQQLSELNAREEYKRKALEDQLREINRQDSLYYLAMQTEIDSLKKSAVGYPIVSPSGDTLFSIFCRTGNLSAKERAELVGKRLNSIYADTFSVADTISLVSSEDLIHIQFKDQTIMSITEYDAMWFEKPQIDLANSYYSLIQSDRTQYLKDSGNFFSRKNLGYAFLILILQIVLIRLVNYFFKNKVDKYILSQRNKALKGITFKGYKLFDEEKEIKAFLLGSKTIRRFINLIQLYITIPLLFSIFPPTRRLAETLFNYVKVPALRIGSAIVDFIPNIFTIAIIIILARYLVRFLKYITDEIASENLKIKGFYPDWAAPTFGISRFFVLAFMFIAIFPFLPGANSPVFQGVSVFLGIVFSLGSTSVISNLVAGLVLTYMRPFNNGDRIKIGELVGDVVEKTAFVTRIKTSKNEFITLPNSNVMSSNVVNFNTSNTTEGIILHTTVTIGYDVPWKQVHELLIDAALKTNLVLNKPKPFVLQTSLDDFYVSYQLNVYSKDPNKQAGIYSELHQNIQDAFNQGGVEILSPHYRAQRDGNMITTPANYLPADYEAPHFRFGSINQVVGQP